MHARACAQVLARLVLDHPGVRHRCVADAAEAADHVSQLTKALATQPFKVQVRFRQPFPVLFFSVLHAELPDCKEYESAYRSTCRRILSDIIHLLLPMAGSRGTQAKF